MKRSDELLDTFPGLSVTALNDAIARGYFPDAVPLSEEQPERAVFKRLTGAHASPRSSASNQLKAKLRQRILPFHMVAVDACFAAADAQDPRGLRYILRFVCMSTGKKKSFATRTKDEFVDAFRLYLAWIDSIRPIVEEKHSLPPNTLKVSVLVSDRDSCMTNLTGKYQGEFDSVVVKNGILRYFGDVGSSGFKDGRTAGAVEQSFEPTTRASNAALAFRGAPTRFFLHAWGCVEDQENQLPNARNWLGNGEPPDVTLGLANRLDTFHPFFTPCTFIPPQDLYFQDDGSLATQPSGTVDGNSIRGGKVKKVRSLLGFYLRSGGGLTTSWNGAEFGGYMIYCPALDTAKFKGNGIVVTRNVTFHPRLYPLVNPTTQFTTDVTQSSAILRPKGTSLDIPVSRFVKSVEIDLSTITDGLPHSPVSPPHAFDTTAEVDDVPSPLVGPSTVGESISGQRTYELGSAAMKATTESLRGEVALEDGTTDEIAKIPALEAKKIVNDALHSDAIFNWRPGAVKSRDSGVRYAVYSTTIRTCTDYSNMLRQKLPGITKDIVSKADLVNNVQNGLLWFSDREQESEEVVEEVDHRILYIDDSAENVTRRVLTKVPNFSKPNRMTCLPCGEKGGCLIYQQPR